MIKPSEICINNITPEQIGKCHKLYDCQKRENFYMVENERGDFDENGDLIEYQVRYSKERGFTCTCKAGQFGFHNCKYGYCKHVAWSVAAAAEERAVIAEISKEQAEEVLVDANSQERLDCYRELAAVTPNEQVRVCALKIVARIEASRKPASVFDALLAKYPMPTGGRRKQGFSFWK